MSELPAPLTTAHGAAYAHGAQVVAWTPPGGEPVVWLSPSTSLTSGAAIRGGIPVCFPWFGPGRFGDRTPAHGFARTTTWRPAPAPEGALAFELGPQDLTAEQRAAWPHPFAARLEARLGDELVVSLTCTNPADEPLDVEAALHTYLAVGDVRRVEVRGLEGAQYVDKVDAGTVKEQHGPVTFDGETDRVYASAAAVDVVDPVLGRTLHVTNEGATKTVVWNPGEAKAAAMADLTGWDRFCCVEAANALDGSVTVAPGASHTLTQRIAVR